MKIKTKISAPVFLLVAALMGFLALSGYHYLAHVLTTSISRQHAELLTLAANQIDTELLHHQEMLGLVARGIDPHLLQSSQAAERVLEQVTGPRSFFDGGFELYDGQGRLLASSPKLPQSPGAKTPPHVAMALATAKPCASPPYRAQKAPHHPTVTFCVPVRDHARAVAAVLVAHHDLYASNRDHQMQYRLGEEGRLMVLQKNRTVIRHPDPGQLMATIPPGRDPGIDDAIQENRLAFGESADSGGRVWITCAVPLEHGDWVVAVQFPESEAHLPLKEARYFFAGALVLILGLTLLTLRGLIRRVTAPLTRLIDHVRTLSSGEGGERRIDIATGDELEHLTHAVNEMVGEMDKRRETLEENRELYRIIADFTSELALLRNPDGTIRYISSNCLALTGYLDSEFLRDGQLLDRIIHPEDREAWSTHSTCYTGAACAPPVNVRLVARNGEARWFNFSCHQATAPDGELLGVRGSFRDVSQNMMLERMLDEQRQFAENLLENTSTPLFVIDRDHRVIAWNRAMTELTGLHAGEMIGTDRQWTPFYREKRPTLADLVMSGDMERAGNLYTRYDRDVVMKGMVRAEGWYKNLNGKDRYLFFDAAPVTRDGETVAVVETLYDITERVRAEESLRLFSQAVEQSANAIVITDPAGVIQYVNRKFCEVSGYEKEEALGQNPSILKSGSQPPEVYADLWRTISEGRQWHGELHNRRKNGTCFWESALISPICDQNGRLTHFIGIKEEISARKDAERQILKNQAELVLKHEQLTDLFRQVEKGKREWEQTMDCVDDLIVMVDADGRIRRCNRAFETFAGTGYRKLLSSRWEDLLMGAGLDLDALEGESGELCHQESGRWFTVRRYPYGDQGWSVIMLHDLTEIKKVSEELATAYEELKATHFQLLQQEKMASIGQLAAGVAHEINNPMGFISSNLGTMVKYLERLQSFLELQSAGLEEVAPEELKEELSLARKKFKVDYVLGDARNLLAESQDGAERVRTIVQNLKSFSRVDEAQATYVDLNECLESTVTIAWNEIKYKATLSRDYGELPQVRCLPQQLNQVFLNILVNAAHAIEKQGEIYIRTRCDGKEVTVAIHDTGGGIPDRIKSRIFEPFFTTKEVGKGTGLGLSISYDIIKKHKGSIDVESSPETGTTFTVRLPVEGGLGDEQPDPDTVRR